MSKIVISADSAVDLSNELCEKYDVKVFGMTIVMGEEQRTDGVDVHTTDVFDYVKRTGTLTSTSAGSIGEYEDYFTKLTADGSAVVHFSLGNEFSSTHRNAVLAGEEVENVFVVDSANLSTGIGLLVLKACDMRSEGMSAQEIAENIAKITDKVRTSFVLDTLDYMKKGGRCSSVAALGANLLKLKPCIAVVDGKMGVEKKYRGKISEVYKQYVKEHLPEKSNLDTTRVFVTHTCVYDDSAKQIVELVRELDLFDEVLETTAGSTVSVHCGPNTLGVLFIEK